MNVDMTPYIVCENGCFYFHLKKNIVSHKENVFFFHLH